MKHLTLYILCCLSLLLTGCGRPSLPDRYQTLEQQPPMFPDYADVCIPVNIAPLNFCLPASEYASVVASIQTPDGARHIYGRDNKVQMDENDWRQMLAQAAGDSLRVEVYALPIGGGEWQKFRPFALYVMPDSIDPWISYRLIEASYIAYEELAIVQRNLTTFDERDIYNNLLVATEQKSQCINCHSYQNYRTDNMLFHMRRDFGGTMLVTDGKVRVVDLRRQGTLSAGVYPAWHPSLPLIAFSTDRTHQWFHTKDPNKVEVFDDASDLILYDVTRDSVLTIAADTARLEVFPAWSPDGAYLYYCSAASWASSCRKPNTIEYRERFRQLHYGLYRRPFDAATLTFGPEERLYDADSLGVSVSLPRVSPDGRYLLMAEGAYGYFHIWHNDADIRMIALEGDAQPDLTAFNSERADSYPTWSSNGRWVMCASRRDDGNASRPYIGYFDGQQVRKPFEVPQRDPERYLYQTQGYNRPEFMVEPVRVSPQTFAEKALHH